MYSKKNQQLIITGLMTSLIFIGTRAIQIPTLTGYIHLGDAMIFIASILLNWKYAAFAAGVGSSFADLSSGYTQYAIPTLIIKGIMCIIISYSCKGQNSFTSIIMKNPVVFKIRNIIGFTLAGLFMILGYYITEIIMYRNYILPLNSILFNILQFTVGIIIAQLVLSFPSIKELIANNNLN